MARQAREFVVEFFGTDKLKPLFLKASGDTVELKSGVIIQIDSSSAKLSHGALAVIELADGPAGPTELKSDAEIARDLCHMFLIEAHGGTGNDEDRRIALDAARFIQARLNPPDDRDPAMSASTPRRREPASLTDGEMSALVKSGH